MKSVSTNQHEIRFENFLYFKHVGIYIFSAYLKNVKIDKLKIQSKHGWFVNYPKKDFENYFYLQISIELSSADINFWKKEYFKQEGKGRKLV